MCDEEECNWKKAYATQIAAVMGLRRHKGHRHGSDQGKDEREKAKGEKGEKEKPTEEPEKPTGRPDISTMQPREIVAFYGPDGLDMLKRQRLSEFLSIAPGVGEKIAQWVLKQWDADPSIRRSANNLFNVLGSSGVRQEMAYRIANMLYAMDEEYKDILNRPVQIMQGGGGPQPSGPTPSWPEPPRQPSQQVPVWNPWTYRYEVPPTQGPQPPTTQPPTIQPPSWTYGWPQPSPSWPSPRAREPEEQAFTKKEAEESFRRILKESREADKLERLEQAVLGVGNQLEELQKRSEDLQKRIESGETGPRRREEEETPLQREMKDRLDKLEEREQNLTTKLHDAERALDKQQVDFLTKQLEANRQEIIGLRSEISASVASKTVEGYKDDGMRAVGQGMQTLGQVARERKPGETMARYIFGGPQEPQQPPPPESLGGLAGRLSPRFVTRVQ